MCLQTKSKTQIFAVHRGCLNFFMFLPVTWCISFRSNGISRGISKRVVTSNPPLKIYHSRDSKNTITTFPKKSYCSSTVVMHVSHHCEYIRFRLRGVIWSYVRGVLSSLTLPSVADFLRELRFPPVVILDP